MTASRPAPVRALSIHAGYRCGNSGACCSSGWDIPVERRLAARLRRELPAGDACFRGAGDGRDAPPVALAREASGRCVFLEGAPGQTRCTVHRRLGEEALPSVCRQFPRVVTLTPNGVSVTLSHYCPTAAASLFAHGHEAVRIVESPPAFPKSWPHEGLDAREALPPLLRPGVLMTWAALERWEEHAVDVLTAHGRPPEGALDDLAAAAEAARRWSPEDGDFDVFFGRLLEPQAAAPLRPEGFACARFNEHCVADATCARGARCGDPSTLDAAAPTSGLMPDARPANDLATALDSWDFVVSTVPEGHPRPRRTAAATDVDARALVDRSWRSLALPIGRWLAAKAFASWLALQGEGLRTSVLGLRAALGVLRAEAARGCADAAVALDATLLKDAIRRADLLLLHLADPAALARRLGRAERDGVLASKHRG